ncbi:MAG: aminoglycoside phosphotransferase family protein [Fimbriimonadaceae bacterium]|nr:aminoglycoside phosphotransferase family protein [Fimbriimonadaceae bacterium]
MPQEQPPSLAQVEEFLLRHGLPTENITLLPPAGMVNHVFCIGDTHCLRVNRQDVEEDDAYTERAVLPIVALADIPHPRLLVFDDSRTTLPTAATVYEWIEGETVGTNPPTFAQFRVLAGDLGRAMARIHALPTDRIEERFLDPADPYDLDSELANATREMTLDGYHLSWFARWGQRLMEAGGPTPTRFIHNDLHGGNIMYDGTTGHLRAILDWGDVGYGDPAIEFNTLPVWIWDDLLVAYESEGGTLGPGGEFRLLAHYIDSAFRFMSADFVNMKEIHSPWWPRPLSRWAELTFWMARGASPRWSEAFQLAFD